MNRGVANFEPSALFPLAHVRSVLVLRDDSFEVHPAYTLEQCHSCSFDVIHYLIGADEGSLDNNFLSSCLRSHECIEPVILTRIPQQIESKEARLSTTEE